MSKEKELEAWNSLSIRQRKAIINIILWLVVLCGLTIGFLGLYFQSLVLGLIGSAVAVSAWIFWLHLDGLMDR